MLIKISLEFDIGFGFFPTNDPCPSVKDRLLIECGYMKIFDSALLGNSGISIKDLLEQEYAHEKSEKSEEFRGLKTQ